MRVRRKLTERITARQISIPPPTGGAYSIAPSGWSPGTGGFEATLVCRSVATAWAAPSLRAALNASPLAIRLSLDAACVAQLALHSCVMRVAFLAPYLASLRLKPMR